jgi:hypothetical protein
MEMPSIFLSGRAGHGAIAEPGPGPLPARSASGETVSSVPSARTEIAGGVLNSAPSSVRTRL